MGSRGTFYDQKSPDLRWIFSFVFVKNSFTKLINSLTVWGAVHGLGGSSGVGVGLGRPGAMLSYYLYLWGVSASLAPDYRRVGGLYYILVSVSYLGA